MIIYTGLTAIIRADNSPKYSMSCLLVGAIINLILDPIFIFKFNMGVKGGALATIIGQIISSIMAIMYIPKIKTVDLKKNDFIPDKSIFKILGYGASSFITQMTILVLFVYMNNIMTKYGKVSEFGGELYNLDDNLFKYEEKVILEVSKNPCVIVGRCSDYILKNKKNVIKIFLYSDLENKINRGVKYYGLSKEEAKKKINKVNKDREKYHKYFCNQNYKDLNNYDLFINVDKIGIDKTVELIKEYIDKRFI